MLIDTKYSQDTAARATRPKSHPKLFKHHRGGSNQTEEERQQEAIKRRTIQNRIAQRLYRQRKDNRIAELEAQVSELLAKREQDHEHQHQSNFEAVQVEILEKRVKDLEAENAKLKATPFLKHEGYQKMDDGRRHRSESLSRQGFQPPVRETTFMAPYSQQTYPSSYFHSYGYPSPYYPPQPRYSNPYPFNMYPAPTATAVEPLIISKYHQTQWYSAHCTQYPVDSHYYDMANPQAPKPTISPTSAQYINTFNANPDEIPSIKVSVESGLDMDNSNSLREMPTREETVVHHDLINNSAENHRIQQALYDEGSTGCVNQT
ncbi:hypothetical protein HDU79_008243 [Rhizoclosmatium sp. JEL0117]|nr:hypothetical protein HDU79_008243 [Rhizoclosmatium sp. JEL0117]